MKTCGNCTHYDRARTTSYGMAPCAKERGVYRLARFFAPAAPCNKAKFVPISGDPQDIPAGRNRPPHEVAFMPS